MSQEYKAHLEGSGAIAQEGSVAAGERGVAAIDCLIDQIVYQLHGLTEHEIADDTN